MINQDLPGLAERIRTLKVGPVELVKRSSALGTGTGGSVRIPAALCGGMWVQASFGALGLGGAPRLAPTMDHPGFLCPGPGEAG